MALLGVVVGAQADDTDQLLHDEGAEYPRLRDAFLEPVQRLLSLILEGRGEGFRIPAQALEADVPVGHGVGTGQQSDLRISSRHGYPP